MKPKSECTCINILKLSALSLCLVLIAVALFSCSLPEMHTAYAADSTDTTASTSTNSGAPSTTGGIVPCGRTTDNPDTPNDETEDCSLCHLALLINNALTFLFSIASALALLALVAVGFFFILSNGNPQQRNAAKVYAKNIAIGYTIVFVAWLLVDFVLSAWGFINPLGGEWNVICLIWNII